MTLNYDFELKGDSAGTSLRTNLQAKIRGGKLERLYDAAEEYIDWYDKYSKYSRIVVDSALVEAFISFVKALPEYELDDYDEVED